MKILFAVLLAACARDAAAQIVSRDSVHLRPLGSVVSGSFILVNKVVPLPEGDFTLVAAEIRGSKFGYGDYARQEHKLVDVALGQMVDKRLRVAIVATALLAWGGGRREWTDEPCKRDDTLFRLNRMPFMKRNYAQNCLMVNHIVNALGESATGVRVKLAAWVRDQGGTTPIATLVDAAITRIEVGEYLAARYVFNPEAYGCEGAPAANWAASAWHKAAIRKDAEKSRFVNDVVEFGKAMQVRVSEGFQGRAEQAAALAATTPALRRCNGTPAQASPPVRTTRENPGSAAQRLKTLEELREQKLISPAEYEERRRQILNSL